MAQVVEKTHRSIGDRLWGRTIKLAVAYRVAALVFVVVAIAALSFSQLGFWSVGEIGGKPVYLLVLLAPLFLGSYLFGPITGALLGLYAGVIVFAHASLFPLDFYEVYFMTPINTFVLLTVLGAVAGWLFDVALRGTPHGPARVPKIVLVSVAMSAMATVLMIAGTLVAYGGLENVSILEDYLLISPLGALLQAVLDALCIIVVCCVADRIVVLAVERQGNRRLLSVFRNWMLVVSGIVFMLSSALIFSFLTDEAQKEARETMFGEVDYLVKQLDVEGATDHDSLLNGFELEIDGVVVITDEKGFILASDDARRYPKGAQIVTQLGYEAEGDRAYSVEDLFDSGEGADDSTVIIQGTDENGDKILDFAFLASKPYHSGYVAMIRQASMVYANRFAVMASITLLAIVLIGAIALVATILLSRVVVLRIDETNGSLARITDGDLGERVKVYDTQEFTSLSTGINKTVGALKGMMDEVEQRNARDLATAKTIQESALPREFPPFPEIDKFDIYASMKTAKEVGGDFYDFFLIGEDDSKLGFVVADVSGKGIPAALFMMAAKTQIRNYMEAELPLGEAIDAANHQLCIGNDAGMFVTVWVGVLDYSTGELTYVNGGHNPPMMLHGDTWHWLKKVSGMPLGLFDGIPYEAHTLKLETGDVLYLYTDGVTEAMNEPGELFGEERLQETLDSYKSMNPRSVGVGVRRAITEFTLDCEQSDDITMLILKYGVAPEKKAVMILPADDKQLVHVYNFIHEELHRRGAPKSAYNPLDIAAEELFVNVCHYAYPDATPDNPGEVRISFEYEATPPSLTVSIADDGIAYNPLAKPDAVTPDDIGDVPIGGLGILMAKRSVDDMAYERVGDSNVVTFVKKW